MQQHRTGYMRQAIGTWVTVPPKDEPLGSLVVIPANSKPTATARKLKECFSPEWWVAFVKAVIEEPIGE